ncbi:MAG TPA: hypothetical protein VK689_09525, partial [Armatimonadota bacterium]|nr:hypothetical protein [Armatimonadota bacterium]
MRSLLWLSALTCAGLTLAGCGGPPPAVEPAGTPTTGTQAGAPEGAATVGGAEPPSVPGKYGGRWTQAQIADPKSFNPWVAAETSTTDVTGPMFEGLNARNSYTLEYEARLADLPKISEDGLTYTYQLREGVVWSDG